MLRDRLAPLEAKVDLLGQQMGHLSNHVDKLVASGARVEEGLSDVRDDLRGQHHVLLSVLSRFRRQEARRQVEVVLGGVIVVLLFWIVWSV